MSDGEGGGEADILNESTALASTDSSQLCQSQGLTPLPLPLSPGLRADVLSRHQQRHVVQQGPRLVLVQPGLPPTEAGEHLGGGHLALSLPHRAKTLSCEAHDLHRLHPHQVTDARVSEHLVNLLRSVSI